MENHLISKISDEELSYILSLKLTEQNVGHKKLASYVKAGSVQYSKKDLDDHRGCLVKEGIDIVLNGDRNFPEQLEDLQISPVFVYYKGDKSLLRKPMLTIVGTRKYTRYGVNVVDQLTELIGSSERYREIVVVSGLAYGIDAVAHRKSMEKGIRTLAVVAGGIGGGFPNLNRGLYDEICKNELVLAEFPPGRVLKKGMFPMRNRIMAALGQSCVVVESPIKSGSLITSQVSLDLGRNVYSVPGSIYKSSVGGNNEILSQGASMLNNEFDMVDMLERLLDSYRDLTR